MATEEKQGISEKIFPPADHIVEARKMAEKVFTKSPEQQLEMISEIKRSVLKRMEIKSNEIKEA